MTDAYQPYYCEENIWWLCKTQAADVHYVLIITNPSRGVAIAKQSLGDPVFWDYHVIALEKRVTQKNEGVWWVHDFDTTLQTPCPWSDYASQSFRFVHQTPPEWHPYFSCIEASQYIKVFSSDRSHMKDHQEQWLQPPPAWPAIYQSELGNTLGRLRTGIYGVHQRLLSLKEMQRFLETADDDRNSAH